MKATKQYFPVLLFISLYSVVLTVESVDEIPVVLYAMLVCFCSKHYTIPKAVLQSLCFSKGEKITAHN